MIIQPIDRVEVESEQRAASSRKAQKIMRTLNLVKISWFDINKVAKLGREDGS